MGEINLYDEVARPTRVPDVSVFTPRGNPAAGLAQGLGNLGESLDKVQLQADTVAAKDADYSLRNRLLELGRAAGGFYTKKGKDATDSWRDFDTQVKQAQADAIKSLPNERARRIAEASLKQTALVEQERGLSHYQTQLDAYEDVVDAGLIASHVNGAATVATLATENDVKEFDAHLSSIAALVRQRAARNGLSGEEAEPAVQSEIRKLQSDAVEGAINTAGTTSAAAMLEVTQRYGSALTGDALGRVREAYAKQLIKETVVDTADQIFAATGGRGEVAESKIAELPASIRNDVRSLVASRARAARSEQRQARADRASFEFGRIDSGVPTVSGGVRPYTYADIPAGLSPEQTSSLRAEVRRREKASEASEPDFVLEAFSLTDEQLRNDEFDLMKYRGHLSPKRFEELTKRTADARRGQESKIGTMPADEAKRQITETAAALFPGTEPPKRARRAAFVTEAQLQLSTQRDPGFAELATLLSRLSTKATQRDGWGVDPDVYSFETVSYDDVPDVERKAIADVWLAAGNRGEIADADVAAQYTLATKTGLSYEQIADSQTLARSTVGRDLTEVELLRFVDEAKGVAPDEQADVLRRVAGEAPTATPALDRAEDQLVAEWAARAGATSEAVKKLRADYYEANGTQLSESEFNAIVAAQRARRAAGSR